MQSILITDCLQHDFVGRIGRFEGLPNRLHVGYDESLRLLGEDPLQGPVARTLAWAHRQPDSALEVIHVRDWHDPSDPKQQSHLGQFGVHCIRDTPGAQFVFRTDDVAPGKDLQLVNATTLSNFVDAGLGAALESHAAQPARVGLMGVWTEAKITFLAYDLRSRFPRFQLAVCSALTASSSRHNHFLALDQLERILGVQVLSSVSEFIRFLGGDGEEAPLIGFSHKHPTVHVAGELPLSEKDASLVRYLFRGSRDVSVRSLDGGFSGNLVLATQSVNLLGQEEVPHVVKIGPHTAIGQERTAFERIESVLGNCAPRVADFADIADRGAIKYRYASMGRGGSRSFQKLYESGASDEEIARVLDSIFADQLGRLYRAAEPEGCDLLDYYQFSERWAASVRGAVVALVGDAGRASILEFPGQRRVQNVVRFYESVLPNLPRPPRSHYFAHIHGDLNGANIIVDAQNNVWLIDFFHSHRGHVLKDLIKLENDLLYVLSKLSSEDELEQALTLSDWLLSVGDLGREPASLAERAITAPALRRAYAAICKLRSFYPELVHADREPIQLLIGQIRYAVHSLGFEESSPLQKRWALYTASRAAEQLQDREMGLSRLRIDWLPDGLTQPGRVGLTVLPGRRDRGRTLDADLEVIGTEGVSALVCLVARDEFARYGVEDLLARYRAMGLELLHVPTLDGSVPSMEELRQAVDWVDTRVRGGKRVLIHCVGGLGRAGTLAACWLRRRGYQGDAAIALVRRCRSERAIETAIQEATIRAIYGG